MGFYLNKNNYNISLKRKLSMKFALIFLVLATFIAFGHAVEKWSDLDVTTFDNHVCDFSDWYGDTPEYGNTCVRRYMTSAGFWFTSLYPWCYHRDGSWGYCQSYTWEVEFPQHRHLIKSESRKKKYYYNYYQTGTTHKNAREIC